jgi:hypothetical protein
LTFWSGHGGASGVAFLLGDVVLEASAYQSVTSVSIVARKVGPIVEVSSFQCPLRRKVVRRRIWRGDRRVSHLFGN